jgi:uncharacterized membrane protein YphA (DoxX/SURF4 family)
MTMKQQSNAARAFLCLWWVLGGLLTVYSVQAAGDAIAAGSHGGNFHVAILASVETIAAVLFLIPRMMRFGGICLLIVFALALAIHAAKGEFASQLLLYAAAVGFIVAHGPVSVSLLLGRN